MSEHPRRVLTIILSAVRVSQSRLAEFHPVAYLPKPSRAYAEQTRGNYHPYQEVIWRGRMDITHAQARDGWELTLDTVPLFTYAGLAVRIDELAEPDSAGYERWSQQVYIQSCFHRKRSRGCSR
jgi:hypothetical protein